MHSHAKLGLGIIGCGAISHAHFVAGAATKGAGVVAAYDRTEKRLNEVSDQYGIARRYTDWHEFLADDMVQAVVICLPEGLHEPVTLEAARLGKHVLTEKPMARNLSESDRMIAAARRAGIVLMVAQIVRRFANHVLAKQWIREGRIGDVSKIVRRRFLRDAIADANKRSWAADPAMASDWLLYGFGSHEYDAILWLLDTNAVSVVATGEREPSRWAGWSAISSTMTLRNGVAADVELRLVSDQPVWETTVTGSKGTLTFSTDKVVLNGVATEVAANSKPAFAAQMAEFVDCVRAGREPGPSGKNVRETMALLEAVGRSLEQNRPVQVDEDASACC